MSVIWQALTDLAVLAGLLLALAVVGALVDAGVTWCRVWVARRRYDAAIAALPPDQPRRVDTIADRCPQHVIDATFAEITDCPVTEQLHEGTDH